MTKSTLTSVCTGCGIEKPKGEFPPSARRRKGHEPQCKPCQNIRMARWRESNPGVHAAYSRRYYERDGIHGRYEKHLKQTYGIDFQIFTQMLLGQSGRCLICLRPMRRANVDHDHATGAVRGLLCTSCNSALGLFADDTTRLQSAISYLLAHR